MTGVDSEDGAEVEMEPAEDFAGVPDHFQRLWTPHRLAYVNDHTQAGSDDCPFCLAPERSDEDALIVHRGAAAYVLLNLYPYNAGHLLVCPYRHVSDYDKATSTEVSEIAALTQQSMRVLRKVARPVGFNLGINQGAVAGAGVAAHLHQHIVPRWQGDSNFFPIIAETRSISFLLGQERADLASAWDEA